MERHGSLTFAKTLKEAYLRLEKMEHAAHIFFYAQLLKRALQNLCPGTSCSSCRQ